MHGQVEATILAEELWRVASALDRLSPGAWEGPAASMFVWVLADIAAEVRSAARLAES